MAGSPGTAVTYDNDKWGWVMVASLFVCCFVTMGNIKALGVLLIPINNDFDSDLWIIGWIAVWYNVTLNCLGPVVGALSRILGSRPMMIFGGLLCTAGFMLTSISTTVSQVAIFIIGLAGVGSSFVWFNNFAAMAWYFKDNYVTAFGIGTMGMPIGIMTLGPVTQVLVDTYGWRGTMLVLGGVSFHLVACGMLAQRDQFSSSTDGEEYQVLREDDSMHAEEEANGTSVCTSAARNLPEQNLRERAREFCRRFIAALDCAVLTDVRFVLLTTARCTVAFAFSGWMVYMVSHGQFQGLTETQASFLPTAFGIGNIIGKAVAPVLHCFSLKPRMTILACFGCGLLCVSLVGHAFIRPFIGQMAVVGVVGAANSLIYQTVEVMTRFLSTDDRLVSILGWQGVFTGVAAAFGGLTSGLVYEWSRSFSISFCMYGGLTLLAIPLLVIDDVIYTKQRQR
ncbi:monocarboxylate transporter 3-like [Patiria miniata]|uniref:Monocarboxylate transporter n=1 Tax=Patiria miniata TaxID=46514 RepID=A0A914BLI1_PATMI|nr:monocarboxylate transporter 3-like [Patiria miniata]